MMVKTGLYYSVQPNQSVPHCLLTYTYLMRLIIGLTPLGLVASFSTGGTRSEVHPGAGVASGAVGVRAGG